MQSARELISPGFKNAKNISGIFFEIKKASIKRRPFKK
jgi:hypothetical protein